MERDFTFQHVFCRAKIFKYNYFIYFSDSTRVAALSFLSKQHFPFASEFSMHKFAVVQVGKNTKFHSCGL